MARERWRAVIGRLIVTTRSFLSASPMQLSCISREIFIEWPVPIDQSIVDCNGHLTLVFVPAGDGTPPCVESATGSARQRHQAAS